MFSKLYNEAIIEFDMRTESPLFIKSSDDDQLNPSSVEYTYFKTYRNGKIVPTIPGSSLKGVFRSTAEHILGDMGACNVISREEGKNCSVRIEKEEKNRKENKANNVSESLGKYRYRKSCPVCKIFGSPVLKSRIAFNDAYPVGEVKIGRRTSVAIDRISGASNKSSLFDFEFVEDAVFRCRIHLRNFFRWHIKLIFYIFEKIDEGFTTFGGFSSKGFGRMKVENESIIVRYYDCAKRAEGYSQKEFYIEKKLEGREKVLKLLKDISLEDKHTFEGCEFEDDKAL